jgi:hypothetical protein
MTDFSWLYGGEPEGHPCADCGSLIGPRVKRQRWDKEARQYTYDKPEVCDECEIARRRAAADSSPSTFPLAQSLNLTGLISRALGIVAGPR